MHGHISPESTMCVVCSMANDNSASCRGCWCDIAGAMHAKYAHDMPHRHRSGDIFAGVATKVGRTLMLAPSGYFETKRQCFR